MKSTKCSFRNSTTYIAKLNDESTINKNAGRKGSGRRFFLGNYKFFLMDKFALVNCAIIKDVKKLNDINYYILRDPVDFINEGERYSYMRLKKTEHGIVY